MAAASARDRERLRPEALEAAGWRVLRVTPSAWAEDRDREIGRIAAAAGLASRKRPECATGAAPHGSRPHISSSA